MQGNDKNYQGTPQEELLSEVLNACMEEQLSFIPPEREIARMHTFSEEFREYMKKLLQTKGNPEQKQITKREFVYRFNKIAACLLVLFVAGGLCAGAFLLLRPGTKEAASEAPVAAAEEESAADAEVGTGEDATESAIEEEAAAQAPAEAAPEEGIPEEPESETQQSFPEEVTFMGSQIHLASEQYLPEETEYVKTLVNSPLVDREAESIKVTIGNMNEHPIYYYEVMDLEVLIDGAWYLVPSKQELTEEEQRYMEMLEPEMAQDEEVLLEYYDLDYEAEKYRIVTYLDGLILCSEFRFENLEEDLEEVLDNMEE